MFDNKYPYTNFHEMNLDWLLNKMHELEQTVLNVISSLKNKLIINGSYNQETETLTLFIDTKEVK